MKLTLLGTGSFISDLEHMGSGYLIEIGNKKILVDAGCGVQIQLLKKGIGIADLDYIFITHFHPDHTCDLFSLLMRRYMLTEFYKKDVKELKIFGPKGIKDFVKQIGIVSQLDLADRFKKIFYTEMTDGQKEEINDFSVTAYKVDHLGSDCVAYRVESGGKSVVLSGDTTKCKGVLDALPNADIFIADCSLSKVDTGKGPHLSSLEIGEISQKMNVKKVILSHLLPRNYEKNLVGEVKEKFSGEVVLGEDLMEIEI